MTKHKSPSVRKAPSRFARSAESTAPQSASAPVDLATEYHYVIADLRRIGIIAVLLVVLLIGLSLVIVR